MISFVKDDVPEQEESLRRDRDRGGRRDRHAEKVEAVRTNGVHDFLMSAKIVWAMVLDIGHSQMSISHREYQERKSSTHHHHHHHHHHNHR